MGPTDGSQDASAVPGRPARPVVDLNALETAMHLCAFYQDEVELERVASTFVASGLAVGDRVLYVASDRSPAEVRTSLTANGVPTEQALANDQLLVRDFEEVYGASADLDLTGVAAGFRELGARSRAEGFPGMRVAAEMGDAARAFGSTETMLHWERVSSRLVVETGITSVCQYDVRRFENAEADLLAVEHSGFAPGFAPAPLAGFVPQKTPWGLRVVGEVDGSNRAELLRVLRARLSVRPQLRLDVGALSFVDVATVREVYRVAAELPEGGSIVVVNASAMLRKVVELAGFSHARVVIEP